jgi:hypothetical protein
LDPSSPFGGDKAANQSDEEAIGLTFSFNADQQTVTINSLSNNRKLLEAAAQQKEQAHDVQQGVRWTVRIRVEGNVIEQTGKIETLGDLEAASLGVDSLMGHGTFF